MSHRTRRKPSEAQRTGREVSTERRRLLQPLWNALDEVLAPRLSDGAVLAVSGGPDSRALLEVVARWPKRHLGVIRVVSVDHGTRAESAAESAAVVGRAVALGFEARAVAVLAPSHDEGSLRAARMAALVDAANDAGVAAVVLAQHLGDVAEGVLHASLGGGGDGAAMPRVGRWHRSALVGVDVLRPFRDVPRDALRLALSACGVDDVFTDPERSSARARLRREVLAPEGLAGQQRRESLAATGRRQRDDEDVLAPLAGALVSMPEQGILVVAPGPPALVRRALRQALGRLCPGVDVRSSSVGLEVALALLARRARGRVHLRGASAEVTDAGVELRRSADPAPPEPPT